MTEMEQASKGAFTGSRKVLNSIPQVAIMTWGVWSEPNAEPSRRASAGRK
jgi:hypothetical protein